MVSFKDLVSFKDSHTRRIEKYCREFLHMEILEDLKKQVREESRDRKVDEHTIFFFKKRIEQGGHNTYTFDYRCKLVQKRKKVLKEQFEKYFAKKGWCILDLEFKSGFIHVDVEFNISKLKK